MNAILLFFVSSLPCDVNLKVGVGLGFYEQDIPPKSSFCVTSDEYPITLALYDCPSDANVTAYSTDRPDLNDYEVQDSMNKSSTFITKGTFGFFELGSISGGKFRITAGSLPGMCETGVLATNKQDFDFEMDTYALDDICIIPTTPFIDGITVSFDEPGSKDLNLLYRSFTDYELIQDQDSFQEIESVPFIRIIVGDSDSHVGGIVQINSTVPELTQQTQEFLRIKTIDAACINDIRWYSDALISFLIGVLAILIIGLIIASVYTVKRMRSNR